MLNVCDLRAFEGPNLYDLVPVTVLRYVGPSADIDPLLNRLAHEQEQLGMPIATATFHGPSALGEHAVSWRTPYPETLRALLEHILSQPNAPSMAAVRAELQREKIDPSLAATLVLAQDRDLPLLRTSLGWRIGHGVRSWEWTPDQAPPWDTLGRIPIVAITGTNGKTTTTRLIDHTLRTAGVRTGRTDTDGIWINGQLSEGGDWTGYGGAQRILASPDVETAVLETARGGLLRRGIAFDRCSVAVLTNVAEDHLPDRGIGTVSEMARAKATVVRVLSSSGRAVLNADDPTLVATVAPLSPAPIIWFSLHGNNSTIAAHRLAGGTAVCLHDEMIWLVEGSAEHELIAVAQLPVAFGGLARHNIANTLAAAAALHALGLSPGQIVLGLASFRPDPLTNPGRMNIFSHAGITVVLDYAHNSDGLRVLLESIAPLRGTDGRIYVIYSGTGDRTDAQIIDQSAIIGSSADRFIIKRDPVFLRGRPPGEIEPLMWQGAQQAGMAAAAISEVDGDDAALDLALAEATAGDVIVFTVHKDRTRQIERLQRWEGGNGE